MLCGDARGGAVRPAEYDRGAHLSAGHVERLRRRIDDLVDRLHGEVEGHEFDDRLQACERGTDAETGKAMLGDRRIDDAPRTEFLQQPLRHLVGALIFGDLFAHDEDLFVTPHFFGHGVAQGFAHRLRHHLRAFRHVGFGQNLDLRRRGYGRNRLGLVFRLFRCRRIGRIGFIEALLIVGPIGLGHRRGADLDRGSVFTLAEQNGDRCVHGNVGRAFGDKDLSKFSLVDGFDFHRRLVGFDLGDDIAGLHRVAFLLQPLGKVALLHRGRERGHQDFYRHGRSLFNQRQCYEA